MLIYNRVTALSKVSNQNQSGVNGILVCLTRRKNLMCCISLFCVKYCPPTFGQCNFKLILKYNNFINLVRDTMEFYL